MKPLAKLPHGITAGILTLVLLAGVSAGISASKPAFSVRAWDLGSYQPEKVRFWIDEAKKNDINLITFSHGISMDWWELLGGTNRSTADYRRVLPSRERTQNVEAWCGYAKSRGIPAYLWQHVIELPPDRFLAEGTLDFDNPGLMDWVTDTYGKVADAVASAAGLVILFTEASHQIHRDLPNSGRVTCDPMFAGKIKSSLPPDERMLKVIMTLYRTLQARGKKLIVRDFFRTPTEEYLFWKAMQQVPANVMVISRHITDDFRYNYPPNPVLGKLRDRVHIMEIQPSWTYGAEYFKSLIQMARERGMAGIIPRIRNWGEDDPRGFLERCSTALMENPDLDLMPLWRSQYKDDKIINILKRYTQIALIVDYPLNLYTGKGRGLADPAQNDSRVDNLGTIGYYSDSKDDVDAENLYAEGGPEAIEKTVAWLKRGEMMANQSIQELKRAGAEPECIKPFSNTLKRARTLQIWAPAYLAFRYYRNHPLDPQAKAGYEQALKAGLSSGDGEAMDYCRNLEAYAGKALSSHTNPKAPTDLKAEVVSGSIHLSWRDNSTNERYFFVERKESYPGIYHQIGILSSNSTSFTDEHVDPSETYTYRVRANSLKGNSPHTYPVTVVR